MVIAFGLGGKDTELLLLVNLLLPIIPENIAHHGSIRKLVDTGIL